MIEPQSEMLLPDSYHRAKRAALAFSAILILVSLAKVADGTAIKVPSVGAEIMLELGILRLALWVAAAYHVWLFWLERGSASLINSEFMRGAGAEGFEGRMSTLVTATEAEVARIQHAASEVAHNWNVSALVDVLPVEHFVAQLQNTITATRHRSTEPFIQAPEMLATAIDGVRSKYLEDLEKSVAAQQDAIATYGSHFQAASDAIADANRAIGSLAGDVRRIAAIVTRFRVMSFNHADRTVVYALFGLATLINFFEPYVRHHCISPWARLCIG